MIRIFVFLMSLALAFPTVSTFAQDATDVAALADFGNPEPDDELFDVQTITDAMMTTQQKLGELGIRFLLNLVVCWILVQFFYYRKSRRRDYYFTFMIFSSAMLALLYVMGSVSVGVGMTLGLFAIFGVIRYRTETVPIREMTYLFIIIALAAVNGLASLYQVVDVANKPHYALELGNVAVLAIVNLLIVILIAILETAVSANHTTTKLVLYDRIDMIVPEKRDELIADLEKRIGIKINSIEIGHVDFLKDAAFIKVTYDLQDGETNTINTLTKANKYAE